MLILAKYDERIVHPWHWRKKQTNKQTNKQKQNKKNTPCQQWQHSIPPPPMGGLKKLFWGQKSEKCMWSVCFFVPFLCWNCQIWSNSNAFEIILGKIGGVKKII